MARTEKELKAESGGAGKKAKRISLPVKVANFSFKKRDGKATEAIATEEVVLETAKTAPVQAAGNFSEQVERQKRFIILAGVTFFMVVIAALWALSLGANLRASRAELSAKSEGAAGLDDITGELGRELDKIKGELDQAVAPEGGFSKSDAALESLPITSTTPVVAGTSTDSATSTVIAPEVVERLKEKLK
jgi:hypothetical protein